MLGTILSLIPSIIGLFSSSKASDEYQAELEKIRGEQKISASAEQAKQRMAELTTSVPGYETARQEILSREAETLNQAKDWLTGGGVVDFLAKSSAATNQQLRQLEREKLDQLQKQEYAYANFLGGPMAGYETDLAGRQTQLGIASAYTGAEKSATQSKYMFGMGNALAGIADEDLYQLIALLSGKGTGGITPAEKDYSDVITNYTPYNWT